MKQRHVDGCFDVDGRDHVAVNVWNKDAQYIGVWRFSMNESTNQRIDESTNRRIEMKFQHAQKGRSKGRRWQANIKKSQHTHGNTPRPSNTVHLPPKQRAG